MCSMYRHVYNHDIGRPLRVSLITSVKQYCPMLRVTKSEQENTK